MALAIVHSRASFGIDAPLVQVEVHLSNGLPNFAIVGLPEAAVRESRERVRSALLNCQLEFPQQRITINLAPVELPKAGGRFDLAIAVGILAASGQLGVELPPNLVLLGELALSGEVRRVGALLPSPSSYPRLARNPRTKKKKTAGSDRVLDRNPAQITAENFAGFQVAAKGLSAYS